MNSNEMEQFGFSEILTKVINYVAENGGEYEQTFEPMEQTISNCNAHNLLLGILEPDPEELDIGFLASRPFSGKVTINPKIKEHKSELNITPSEIKEHYEKGLLAGKNSLSIRTRNLNICIYFPMELEKGTYLARLIRWYKASMSLTSITNIPADIDLYYDILKNKEYSAEKFAVRHTKIIKAAVRDTMQILGFCDYPDDVFYDALVYPGR